MEYDRALYRVYERIMEDLNGSSPLVARSSSSSSSSPRSPVAGVGGITRAPSWSSSWTPSIPLFLPLKLGSTVDVIIDAIYRRSADGIVRHVWLTFRGLMDGSTVVGTGSDMNNSGSQLQGGQQQGAGFDGVATGRSRTRRHRRSAGGGILRRGGFFGWLNRTGRHRQHQHHVRVSTTDEEDLEAGVGGGESGGATAMSMTSTSVATTDTAANVQGGLRRRSPSRGSGGSDGSSSSVSSRSGSGSSSFISSTGMLSDDEEEGSGSDYSNYDYDAEAIDPPLTPPPSSHERGSPPTPLPPPSIAASSVTGGASPSSSTTNRRRRNLAPTVSNDTTAVAATTTAATTTLEGRASALVAQIAARNQPRRNRALAISDAATRRRQQQSSRRRRRRNSNNNNNDGDGQEDDESQHEEEEEEVNSSDENGGCCTQKGLYRIMRLTMIFGFVHLFVLLALHSTYVGAGMHQRHRDGVSWIGNGKVGGMQEEEQYGQLKTCIEYALATRPPEERGEYYRRYGNDSEDDDLRRAMMAEVKAEQHGMESDREDYYDRFMVRRTEDDAATSAGMTAEAYENENEHGGELSPKYKEKMKELEKGKKNNKVEGAIFEPEPPLLGKDEILQIKILYGGECIGQCSRVHTVMSRDANATTAKDDEDTRKFDQHRKQQQQQQEHETLNQKNDHISSNRWYHSGIKAEENVDPLSTPEFWKEPHYRFATNEALLFLDEKILTLHNVTLVNVTLTERCLSTGSDHGRTSFLTRIGEFLSPIYGMDSAIINQLMYGIKSVDDDYRNGYLKNLETEEHWSWRQKFLESYDNKNVLIWFFSKIGTIILSMTSFFLITSVTALIVRVLTSSGVVLMFPLISCLRNMGLPGADERILNMSYPWIGRARNATIRRGIHPSSHLITAHLSKIFLYYVMYEACQAAWSAVLYAKSVPAAFPIWIFGFSMVWEYFAMVFVRSALSVYFFPRITFLYFILYHVYFWSVPYGYFDVALIPFFLFMIQAMLYTILALELPAAARGAVSMECPREVYNRLSWPEWTAGLPHEWTLFLPLNSRYTPLYDREVGEDAISSTGENNQDEDGGHRAQNEGENAPFSNEVNGSSTTRDIPVPLASDDAVPGIPAATVINSTDQSGLLSRRMTGQH